MAGSLSCSGLSHPSFILHKFFIKKCLPEPEPSHILTCITHKRERAATDSSILHKNLTSAQLFLLTNSSDTDDKCSEYTYDLKDGCRG